MHVSDAVPGSLAATVHASAELRAMRVCIFTPDTIVLTRNLQPGWNALCARIYQYDTETTQYRLTFEASAHDKCQALGVYEHGCWVVHNVHRDDVYPLCIDLD